MPISLSRIGAVSLPLLGDMTAIRWDAHHGFGFDSTEAGATAWFGRWELVADRGIALPFLAPFAMLLAILPRISR